MSSKKRPIPPVWKSVKTGQKEALHHTSDDQPGISRKRRVDGFDYYNSRGVKMRDKEILARIKSLAIPPAWENVWISAVTNGHVQATGRDARNRKQFRYHPQWREQRDQSKFEHMLAFARNLPAIRRKVAADLRRKEMGREKIVATVVRLLETTVIRVGNDEYARQNHSYGLTTMRNRHVDIKKSEITFSFRGKSGKSHEITLHDSRLAKIIRSCQEMPGQVLFSYCEEEKISHVTSTDVNDYLRQITGSDFTAKDFRTWIGTVLAATAFRELEAVTSESQAKKNIGTVIESVARILGNTPTVCRKCYVHPGIVHAYLKGVTLDSVSQCISSNLKAGLNRLRPDEAAVLALLQRKIKRERPASARENGRKKISKGK